MSSPESRLDWILREARTRSSTERAIFLDGACGGDEALRRRLESLLASSKPSDTTTTQPTELAEAAVNSFEDSANAAGQMIGRYKILEKIGEGGCGMVYVAEQTEPVRRRVAVKVIKLGMDTRAVVARFEAERQALAMMDHPNIARVLDAGSTEAGRPYFVMELVRGIRITDYCDQNNLSTRDRLELFIKVCQAIQHAHQKGIIHRDIKPSNILVTLHDGVPVPKVIDFGIAKATEGRLTDATVYTQLHQFIGTPAYMSPEQAEMSGLDVDTRSDIYSLGVLLYELLTGKTPFDPKELMESGLEAMRKTIREKDPVRPSTKLHTLSGEELTTTAKRHGVEVPKLVSQLRGDLDWIVMKCLEKDRTRRYETANGLAVDLKRHLSNETVTARPPSKVYEFQKTFRRHKVGFVATAAVILVLALGVALTTWQAVRATQAKREEAVQRQKAVEAQSGEAKLRRQAEAQELIARQRAYASDMNLAAQALEEDNLGGALDLLDRQRPGPGRKDLRGWEWRYLWQQTRSEARESLCQVNGEVEGLAVSPDGRWLVVGPCHSGGTPVWDLRKHQQVARLATDEEQVRAAFSPTEPLLAFAGTKVPASGHSQSTLHLWNPATRQTLAELPLDETCVGLAFSNDGQLLVTSTSSGASGRVTFWRMPQGTQLASFASQQHRIQPATGFAATSDLRLAAYALPDGRVRVIDLRDGHPLWNAVASRVFVTALAFSPDGKTLASAAGFGESDIRLWDAATGQETGRLAGHTSWVSSLVFWPDGKKLASSSADQTIRLWDVEGRKCLRVMRGQRDEIWRLVLLPDAKTVVSGGKDGSVCLWDTSIADPNRRYVAIPAQVAAWRFAPDGRSLLTLDHQGQVTRWSGLNFQQAEPLAATAGAGASPVFSPDGNLLAVGSPNGVIQIWDLARKVLWRQWTNTTGESYPQQFLADGDKLLTLAPRGSLFQEWDLTSGSQIQSWPGQPLFLASAMSADERVSIAFGADGGEVRDLSQPNTISRSLDVLEGASAAHSPDGRWLAVGSRLGYVRVWDTTAWREEATLRGFIHTAGGVAFSPDGKRLATGCSSFNKAVKLWDTESWQDVFTLQSESGGFVFGSVGFSRDGSTVGALNLLGNLNLWHAPSWEEISAAEAAEKTKAQEP